MMSGNTDQQGVHYYENYDNPMAYGFSWLGLIFMGFTILCLSVMDFLKRVWRMF